MGFTSTEEASRYLTQVFQAGFDEPDISSRLRTSGVVLRMVLTDPEVTITVDFPHHEIFVDENGPESNVTLSMTADTANRFWQGKVSVPLAIARGQITVSGALPKLLALLPTAKPIQKQYVETLRADGRDDLLA